MRPQILPVLYSVQYLRFIAATLVVLVHAFELAHKQGLSDIGSHFNLGAAGVDIFFVISGFIMCVISEAREHTARDFLTHRLIRVAPPYWAVTALMAGIALTLPHLFDSTKLSPPHLLTSFFFIAWPHPVLGDAMPLYFPGWTLNYEAFFYLSFASCLGLPLKKRVICVSAMLAALVALGALFPFDNEIYKFYTKPILLEFVFGMTIGYFFLNRKIPPVSLSRLLIVAGSAALIVGAFIWGVPRLSPVRFLMWGIPGACLACGFIFLEARGFLKPVKSLKILGDASYATYLTHVFTIGGLGFVLRHFHVAFPTDAILVLLSLAASWTTGLGFHFLFEKPVVGFLRRFLRTKNAIS